ncbi:MAG: ATP-binding cassette domain-containing protein [Rhodospirillales bacterium]
MSSAQDTRQPILETRGLSAGYSGWEVLRGIDLTVWPGETIGILGHNGAGKSTLLRSIAGLLAPSKGAILHKGEDITRVPVPQRVKQGIVLVPQGRALFPDMDVRDNVMLGAFRRSRHDAVAAWDALSGEEPFLAQRKDAIVSRLSGGQQQIVANARGLASGPDVLMVDEPSLGLSGVAVSALLEFLLRLRKNGITTILVEQNVGLAMNACDRFAILKNGELIGVYEKASLPKEELWSLF